MADDGSAQSPMIWPISKFYFQVNIDNGIIGTFQEVSGLDVESQIIEYRHGDSKEFSTIKMPGIAKNANVTLKKGIFSQQPRISDWLNQIKMNTIKRVPITISLLDEKGAPTMVWTLQNAWPTKIETTDQKDDGNDIAIETLEIVHEKLTITNG